MTDEDLTNVIEKMVPIIVEKVIGHIDKRTDVEKLWSPEDLADKLDLKPYTVREYCCLGQIRASKQGRSRFWKIPDDQAQELIAGAEPQPIGTYREVKRKSVSNQSVAV